MAQQVRPLLPEHGRLPTRRTWERRLAALPPPRPGLLGGGGRHLVGVVHAWAFHGRAAAVARTPVPPHGGGWHKQHPETGALPQTAMDTDAGWAKSGWHGWWYGWERHLAVTGGSVWLPWAAELTPATTADNAVAPRWRFPLPAEERDGLGDPHDQDPAIRRLGEPANRALVATRRGAYPHHDDGVEVRRICQQRRSQAIEPFHGWFKTVFEWRPQRPVKGLQRSQLLALGASVRDQLVRRDHHEPRLPLGKAMKPLLRAA